MRRDSAVPRLHVGCITTYSRKEENQKKKKRNNNRKQQKNTLTITISTHTCPQEHTSLKTHIPIPKNPRTRMHECVHPPKHHLMLWQTSQDARHRSLTVFPFPPYPSALLSGEQAHTMRQQRSALRDGRKVLNPLSPTSVDIDPRCEAHCRSVS